MKNVYSSLATYSLAAALLTVLSACGNINDKTSGQMEVNPNIKEASIQPTVQPTQPGTQPAQLTLEACTEENITPASTWYNNAQSFKACGTSPASVSIYASTQSQQVCVFPVQVGQNGPSVYVRSQNADPTQRFVYSCGTIGTNGVPVSFNGVNQFNGLYIVSAQHINTFTTCLSYGSLQTCLNSGVNFSYGQFR